MKALVPVGCAAALAAAFNTPIAAVLFSLEEIMGDLHATVLGSVVLSSATSWMVLHLVLGDDPLFHVAGYQLVHPVEFGVYAVLGVVGGLGSVASSSCCCACARGSCNLPKSTVWLQPVVGGLAVGLMGYFVPEVMGVGYDHVDKVLNGDVVLKMVVLLAVLKIVATAVCYGSGNAGGIFGPAFFIGAMMGATRGQRRAPCFPHTPPGPGAYALVGMGTAFAGIVRTPLTSVIMMFEMTRDYTIIVPLMISNLIAFFMSPPPAAASRSTKPWRTRTACICRRRNRAPTTTRIQVRQTMRAAPPLLHPEDEIGAALTRIHDGPFDAWPVAGPEGLWGMVKSADLEQAALTDSHRTLAEFLGGHHHGESPDAEHLPHVHPDHSLSLALERMGSTGLNALPVVSRGNVRELMGIVLLSDILGAYGVANARATAGAVKNGPSRESLDKE